MIQSQTVKQNNVYIFIWRLKIYIRDGYKKEWNRENL